MGGRAVEGTGLENRQGRESLVGSNPTPSATSPSQVSVFTYNFTMCEDGAPYLRPYFKRDFATRPGTAQDGPAHRTPVAHGVRPRSVSAATSPTTARSLLRGPDRARPTPPPSQLTPARIAEPRRWPRWTGDPSSTLRDGPCRRYDIGPARRPRLLARVRPPRPANASIRRPRAILPSSRPRRPRRPTLADASTPAPAPPPQLAARARPQGGGGGPAATGAPHVCGRYALQRQFSSIGVDKRIG